jgi:inhibitor of cysteine peptidase
MARVEAALGDKIQVKVGDEVVVRLPENPATGYRWELDRPRGSVELADDEYVRPRDADVGGGGERRLTFRATSGGEARVGLRLTRPWEGKAIQQGSVAVTVEP